MSNHHPQIHDVVIAGAGPVGLFLACELRLRGVSVLVLERAQNPGSPLKRLPFGMRGLTAPTIEALDRRGLLVDVVAAQRENESSGAAATASHWSGQQRKPAGHFAGIQFALDDIDTARWPYRLPGAAGPGLMVELETLESVLAARATALGVEILRGCGVDGLEQTDDHVAIRAGGAVHRGRWLVGCDGGRSTVRKAAGFPFAGTDPEFTGYSVAADLADPQDLRPGRSYTPTGMYTFAPPATITMADFDGGAFHRTQPITSDHIQSVLRRVSGTDAIVTELRLASTWTDRAFQVGRYRIDRVLLAGDAAHTHSPLGGQGLNLGLGDAMNLGWKLAATIRGTAPEGLLDSYHDERHPVGAAILDWSRAQVALLRPTPATRALAGIARDLIATRDGATYFAERAWGVAQRYDLGDGHPLMGRSAPDFDLGDGRTLATLLRTGHGVLLDFSGDARLRRVADGLTGRLLHVASDAAEPLGLSACLVRPDGIVAWASEGSRDVGQVAAVVARWFGEDANAA